MYIAKDKDGIVYLFKRKPAKGAEVWVGGGGCMAIHSCSLPKSINPKWEDPEPIKVKLIRDNKED